MQSSLSLFFWPLSLKVYEADHCHSIFIGEKHNKVIWAVDEFRCTGGSNVENNRDQPGKKQQRPTRYSPQHKELPGQRGEAEKAIKRPFLQGPWTRSKGESEEELSWGEDAEHSRSLLMLWRRWHRGCLLGVSPSALQLRRPAGNKGGDCFQR